MQSAMPGNDVEKLLAQQEAIIAALAAIKNQLDAGEWRRKCLWLVASITATVERLKKLIPREEQWFKEFPERLECYAHLTFKSSEDVKTVYTCFTLIASILEDTEKDEALSFSELWNRIRPLTDDLDTLESGDPPSLTQSQLRKRDVQPELRDAERIAVRDRFDRRWRTSIDEMFARDQAEAEQYY